MHLHHKRIPLLHTRLAQPQHHPSHLPPQRPCRRLKWLKQKQTAIPHLVSLQPRSAINVAQADVRVLRGLPEEILRMRQERG